MFLRYVVPIAVLVLAPLAAEAQSYRCVAADGKKYYGQSVPPQCLGQVVEELNTQGSVVKRINPQASADERAKKEAEEAERKKLAAISKEQGRRDQALLATYGSEKDIEDMRSRALEPNQRLVKELEGKVAAIKQRASPKDDAELKLQEGLLAEKKREAAAINAKYDDDKKRYLELTGRK
jgi:hypothetical protein